MKKRAIKITIAAAALIAAVTAAVICVIYTDSRPWAFGGIGAPDTVLLGNGYRLEKVIAFRRNYHVTDIRGGQVIYILDDGASVSGKYREKNTAEYRSGVVSLDGNVTVPITGPGSGVFLAFDDSGALTETTELQTDCSDEPVGTAPAPVRSDNTGILYYDLGGLRVCSVSGGSERVLGMPSGENGEPVTLFSDGSGSANRWQLSEPRFFGDIIVVKIYHSECIYRLVGEK